MRSERGMIIRFDMKMKKLKTCKKKDCEKSICETAKNPVLPTQKRIGTYQ